MTSEWLILVFHVTNPAMPVAAAADTAWASLLCESVDAFKPIHFICLCDREGGIKLSCQHLSSGLLVEEMKQR